MIPKSPRFLFSVSVIIRLHFSFLIVCYIPFKAIGQQYNFDVFTVKNGLIQSNVTGIIQDDAGYLWFGTEGGISKFNGRTFTGYQTSNGLAEAGVQGFVKDKRGRIWVAHTLGKVSLLEQNKFKEIDFSKHLGQSRIQHIFIDSKGHIWLCSVEKGALRFDPENPSMVSVFGLKDGLDDDVYYGMQSDSGIIWFITSIGIKTFNPATSEFCFFKPDGLPFFRFTCIAEDKKRNIWIGTYDHGAIQYEPLAKKWTFFDTEKGLPSPFVTCILSRRDSSVAIGTWRTDEFEGGIALIKEGILTGINRQKGLPGEKVHCLFEDNEGSLWIGLKNRGVAEFAGTKFFHIGKKEGLKNEIINCVFPDESGKIWVGTDAGLSIVKHAPGAGTEIKNYETIEMLSSNQVTDIEDIGSYYAVSTFIGDIGFFDKQTGRIAEQLKINKNFVNCLELDAQKNLWIGSANGLTIYDTKTKKFSEVNALDGKNVLNIKFEKEGKIWIGTREGGLFSGDSPGRLGSVGYFPHRSPTTICITKNGVIWIGTEGGGLFRKTPEGKIEPITVLEKNAGFISGIIETNNGLLVGTSVGFYSIIDERARYYEENDGFVHPEVMLNSMQGDSHGNYWFGTNNGITVFRPSEDQPTSRGPKIILESMQVFSKMIRDRQNISLSFRENDVTFSFTALTFRARGKVRYKYILEGIDKSYQKETTMNVAHYTNLNPGKFHFKVYAKNSDGIWSELPAQLSFEIKPPFWKTTWFIVLSIAMLIGGVWAYVFFRTLNLRRARRELARQVKERTQEIELKNLTLLEANKTILNKNKEITDSINYAKKIQESILPNPADLRKYFPHSFIIYKPKDIVSGDFYWFKEEENTEGKRGRIFIAAADCTGHGVPGAFMCMIGSSLLYQILQENPGVNASGMLQLLDKGIKYLLKQNETDTKDGMDIALCIYDPNKGTLEYAGAMRPMFLFRSNVRLETYELNEYKASKESIGGHLTKHEKVFENHVIHLQHGDCVYFSTDGFSDQFGGEKGKKLMTKKFKELILESMSESMLEQEMKINSFWDKWSKGYEQVDDVLVLGFKINDPHGNKS